MKTLSRPLQRLLFATLLCTTALAQAQMPDFKRDEQLAEMKKLDWMLGEWRGTGTTEFAPGMKGSSDVYEIIKKQLDGLTFSVEGTGTKKGPDGKEMKAHHAYAMIR